MGLLQLKSYFAECFYRLCASPGTLHLDSKADFRCLCLTWPLIYDTGHDVLSPLSRERNRCPSSDFPFRRATALMFVSYLVWQAFRHLDRFLVHKSSFKSLYTIKVTRISQKCHKNCLQLWIFEAMDLKCPSTGGPWAMIIKSRLHAITLPVTCPPCRWKPTGWWWI